MQREWRATLAPVEIEVAGEKARGLHQLGYAGAPRGPEATRKGAEEGTLVDQVEGRLVDRREKIRVPHARTERSEEGARGCERLAAEVDAEHVPSALGEAAHIPGAAAARNQDLATWRRRDERTQLRRDLAGIPGREARVVAQVPEFRLGWIAAGEIGRAHHAILPRVPLNVLMKHFLLVLAGAIAAALIAGCRPDLPDPQSTIALSRCRLPGVDAAVLCGTHEVWEDRDAKAGRRITLHVAVIPARLRAKDPDPIVVLAGGPGQGAIALAPQVMPLFSRLNDSRDIVLLDQRGTGFSHPLDCEDDDDSPLQSLFEDAIPEKAVRRCLESLDADPRQYTTVVAVADLDEVRAALGYDKVNLWGGSYGTRMGLEYIRRHPQHVRSAVLDGVAPAGMKLPLSFVADGGAALERLLEACAAEALCRRSYPDLRETIARLRGQLARLPARVAIHDPRTGERQAITVNENVFLSGLFRPLYVPELASLLPYGVTAAASGDFDPLLAQNLEFADDVAENLSLGMHLSVVCTEDIPRITREDFAAVSRSFFGHALVDDFIRACGIWPRGRVPDEFYAPVRADTPVLILSGGIDPATPPRHGALVARTLPNARHLVAPQLGHGVSLHGCAPRLIDSFVRKASAAELDPSCLERIPRPLFVLPLGIQK